MSIEQIKTGTLSTDGHDCAFLWLYTMTGKPYAKHLPAGAPSHMPMVLSLLRWDGMFGTMGGKVDAGESLREALSREVGEEADFWLPKDQELEELGTFLYGPWHIHSFALEVTFEELLEARQKAIALNTPECAGWVLAPAGEYQPSPRVEEPRGVIAFRANHFAATAKHEFDALLSLIHKKSAARAH
ncbi:NUDIX hydrolase [Paraburkholderia sp. A2RO-4L]|uniref:NUDIX domain-containing protein n=1 Tax=Paraburkholderia sp. A2RO-4L TaxID=3028374 RepID=UPI0032FE77C7|nr:NUDIX hydrolase [Burkholderia vietnamiensis]